MNAQQLMEHETTLIGSGSVELLDETTVVDPTSGVDVQMVLYAIDHAPDPEHGRPGRRQVRVATGSDAEGFGGTSTILYETTQPEEPLPTGRQLGEPVGDYLARKRTTQPKEG